jgi:tetratricopeptide (TPR) repeat protein
MADATEHYMKGLKLFGQARHLEAIEEYRQALQADPGLTDALLALATAQMNANLLDEAIESGRKLVEIDKEDPFAHTTLSMIYQRKGMIEEAEKEQARARMLSWKQELKTNPNAPPPGPAGGMGVIQ